MLILELIDFRNLFPPDSGKHLILSFEAINPALLSLNKEKSGTYDSVLSAEQHAKRPTRERDIIGKPTANA